jgi:hypothetical protein
MHSVLAEKYKLSIIILGGVFMKHNKGECIKIYDGDLIGWTTATLTENVGEIDELERWKMITREGYELVRILDVYETLKKFEDMKKFTGDVLLEFLNTQQIEQLSNYLDNRYFKNYFNTIVNAGKE